MSVTTTIEDPARNRAVRVGPGLAILAILVLVSCGHSPPAAAPADASVEPALARPDRVAAPVGGPAPAAVDAPATEDARAEGGTEVDGAVLAGWRLVWSDEFEGPAGAAPDPRNWKFDVGGDGWGNAELEYHTNRRENSALDGQGNLAITARQEDFMGRRYTSARLNTAGRFSQAYGRFEARIKLPTGRGIWPAFWALGANIGEAGVGWPACGEIDVMENAGSRPAESVGSLHGPGYSGGNPLTRIYRLPGGALFPADFHRFAVEWEQSVVRFFVDDALYQTRTPADVPAGGRWVFDHPFFVILNVAVGGCFPGNPDQTTTFPQSMLVDYVRVYAR